jgi:alpha-L-rhamnosidase
MLTPQHLTCEYFTNPIGLDVTQPRLSWKSTATGRGARQTAYQIQVGESEAALDSEPSWDSGKTESDASVLVSYAGPTLEPRQRCFWRVRVWDENDKVSAWSEVAFWEMGLMDSAHWQADWITPDWEEDTQTSQPGPLLRHSFSVKDGIQKARLYATCLGLYELRLNSKRVGDGLLTPGWTSYRKRLLYQTYDVTDLLQTGENAIGALLGDGWYRGYMGFQGNRNLFGDRLALLLQLEITYADGQVEVISSDSAWRAVPGPIRMSDIYMGETYDAREEKPGWDRPGYDDSGWQGVRKLEHTKEIVVAQEGPFIRRREEIRPQRVFRTPKGETVLDFGQNMVGWVKLRVRGPAGTTITIRHAEVLDQEGNFYTENLREAKQTVQYTLKGLPDADEVFEPRFTFMGFQFIAVEGFPGEPTADNFTGIVLHSDTPPTGSFECSNPMLNQLQHNIIWGQKGNFVDVPTDCPQRDERLGWTGDTQVFIRTACFNMDVGAFFTKWLRDLKADQLADGSVPFVIPDTENRQAAGGGGLMRGAGSAAWSDAATVCPWTIYLCYGDMRLLEEQYPSMVGWVEYMHSNSDSDLVWRSGFHFGDWLDARGQGPLIPNPVTNNELIATAFFAFSTELTARAARSLGKTEEAEKYASLAVKVKEAFNKEFVTSAGRVGPNTQTAYVLALHFDLLPEQLRPAAAKRLADEVRKANYHLTTGFVGTPYLCHVLSQFGYTDVAYELLNQESYPSWLYPVKKGATTIWERWDGIKPDGSFQDAGMNSFNHYAYGAIGEWLYRVVAGIDLDPAKPGYKHILFQPQPGGGLTWVRASLDTPYGLAECGWDLGENGLSLRVTVPPNTRSTVRLPAGSVQEVTESGQPLKTGNGIRNLTAVEETVVIEVDSGVYEFVTSGLTLSQMMTRVRHVAGRLDRHISLADLLANEATKKILVEQLGAEVFQNPQLRWVMNTPLEMLSRFAPQVVTPEKLDEIDKALADIQ